VRARWASAALVFAMLVIAPLARADRITDAEDLFRRGKALVAQGKHHEACPLLAESYRLDPGMGTLLNLALCHEQVGKTASAWGEFRAVEQQARAATPPNETRAQLAREHADKLQPRLSRIKLVVSTAARAPGLVIKIDGEEKAEALWGTGIAVDPGTRTIEASAPHKKSATTKVKIDDEGVVQSVALAPLDDAPDEAPVGSPTRSTDLKSVEEYAANRARRTTGFVIGGLGLATLAAGGVFAVAAIVNDNEAKKCAPCVRGTSEATSSGQATDRALVFANVANVTVPLGIIGVVAGTYLVLSSGPSAKVAIVPVTTPTHAGLSMSGAW
jgi:hypothetical protein